MRAVATRRFRPFLVLLLSAALVGLIGVRAEAQVDPLWDHYKVYEVFPPIAVPLPPVILIDQFTTSTHNVLNLEKFANPVEKFDALAVFPINDPRTHYAWWRITPQPFGAYVIASNQFGDQTLQVNDAHYLWNPALKNEFGPLPIANHYKCYDCQGQPVNRPVGLIDQFDQQGTIWQVTVRYPRLFCNPVEKRIGPVVYPIEDVRQHYTCYDYDPEDPRPNTAFFSDQFVHQQTVELRPSRLLCVPTDKIGVTGSKRDTWGKLKVLYR